MANISENTSFDVNPYDDENVLPERATPLISTPVDQPDKPGVVSEPGEDDIATFVDIAQKLEHELSSIVVGQERVVRELLLALLAGGHVLLEGVPGLGKTLLVRTLSDALSLKFARVQFTPDLMPADIVGTTIVTEQDDAALSGG